MRMRAVAVGVVLALALTDPDLAASNIFMRVKVQKN